MRDGYRLWVAQVDLREQPLGLLAVLAQDEAAAVAALMRDTKTVNVLMAYPRAWSSDEEVAELNRLLGQDGPKYGDRARDLLRRYLSDLAWRKIEMDQPAQALFVMLGPADSE